MILGYNVSVSIGGKTILARTQEDLTIAAQVKESITKDDQGVTRRKVTGHDVSFRISALMELDASGTTNKLDRDDVIALALATGDSAPVNVLYTAAGGKAYGGSAIITNYTESSSADPDSDTTIGLDLQIDGAFTEQS
jgi:hypothetical protein